MSEIKECDVCGFSPANNHHKHKDFHNQKITEREFDFCDLCWNSDATKSIIYPAQTYNNKVVKYILYVGNIILKELKSKQ